MDVFYILQASLMTKYMSEPTNPYIIILFLIYAVYKATPSYIIAHINDTIEYYLTSDYNTSSIVIPFHLKVYSGRKNQIAVYIEKVCLPNLQKGDKSSIGDQRICRTVRKRISKRHQQIRANYIRI